MPRIDCGDTAPEFALRGTGDREYRLEACRGRWLVLAFYPGDFTPVCTRQFCSYRDAADRLDELSLADLPPNGFGHGVGMNVHRQRVAGVVLQANAGSDLLVPARALFRLSRLDGIHPGQCAGGSLNLEHARQSPADRDQQANVLVDV